MKLKISPSEIAKHMLYRCDIRSGILFSKGRQEYHNESGILEKAKRVAGIIFEERVIRDEELRSQLNADKLVDYKKFCKGYGYDPGDPLQDTMGDFIEFLKKEGGKRFLVFNSARKSAKTGFVSGVPLRVEAAPFRRILDTLGVKDTEILEEGITFIDFLVFDLDEPVLVRVGEIKYSEVARAYHAFQSQIYALMLEEFSKREPSFRVSKEYYLVFKGLREFAFIHTGRSASYEKAVEEFLKIVIKDVNRFSSIISPADLSKQLEELLSSTEKAPPLRPTCQTCFEYETCTDLAFEKNSIFLYKSVIEINYRLYESGIETGENLKEKIDLGTAPDDMFVEGAFLAEHELVEKYGFIKRYSEDELVIKEINWMPIFHSGAEDYIYLYGIPSAITGNVLIVGIGVLTKKGSPLDNHFSDMNLPKNFLGDRAAYLLIMIPENPLNTKDMYCAYSILNNVFRITREEWSMLYFLDEPSRNALVH